MDNYWQDVHILDFRTRDEQVRRQIHIINILWLDKEIIIFYTISDYHFIQQIKFMKNFHQLIID